MKHLRQPEGSSCCGQTCVAMVTGKSLYNVTSVFGDHGTHYTTLRSAIVSVGGWKYGLGPIILARGKNGIPRRGTYIAKAIWSRKPHASHFIVVHHGRVYDPGWDTPVKLDDWLAVQRQRYTSPNFYLTSWVEVQYGVAKYA